MSFDDDEHTLDEAWGADPVGDRANDTLRAARRWHAVNGWLCSEVDGCTCGGSGTLSPAHQPGCGLESLIQTEHAEFLAAEHNASLPALAVAVPVPDEEGRALHPRCGVIGCRYCSGGAEPLSPAPAAPGSDTEDKEGQP